MSSRLVEVNLLSATDLSRSKLVNKQWPAALIEFPGMPNVKQYSQSCLNGKANQCIGSLKGNNNPVWNQQFIFRVEETVLLRPNPSLVVRIFASDNFKDREIGTALIPLTGAVYNIEQLQSGSYNVYKSRSHIDGKVNVSVKVSGPRFSSEQLERMKPPQVPQQAQSYLNARMSQPGFGGLGNGYGPPPGYPQAPRAQHYQPTYNQRPQVVYSSQRPGYGGYGGYGGAGGRRRGGMGMGPGLLMGGLGGLALGGALGGDGGGGCGGGGCGGGCGG